MLSFSTSRHAELAGDTFGAWIKKARLEKGLTQRTLAEAADVDEMTVVAWERYATAPLRHRTKVERVCGVLGLALGALGQRFAWNRSLLYPSGNRTC